jgi:hypothetical protein
MMTTNTPSNRLLERRNRGRVTEYLVKWEGYGEEDHSWVKEADIHPDLIKVQACSEFPSRRIYIPSSKQATVFAPPSPLLAGT